VSIKWTTLLIVSLALLSGCVSYTDPGNPPESYQPEITEIFRVESTSQPFETTTIIPEPATFQNMAFTYTSQDGNRVFMGTGGLTISQIAIKLSGIPQWIVGLPVSENSIWYIVLETGQVQAFLVEGAGNFIEIDSNISFLPPGMPPFLVSDGYQVSLVQPPADASPTTHPLLLEYGSLVYIDKDGNLKWISSAKEETLPVNALPDARILTDGFGRLLFLSHPTTSYPHGVLGDSFEATAITLIDTTLDPFEIKEIQIEAGDVVEGIAPLWVDLDVDGKREIIVTQSNSRQGARIVVYSENGAVMAESDPIGQGFRWFHLLAAAQFIDGGNLEIAVVRTPHIGGVVEILSIEGYRLEIKSSIKGYSSHQIGSRNLDASLVSDVNADGIPDIVLPDQSQQYISALQIINSEWKEIWRVPLNGKLTTNLNGVYSSNSGLILGAGTEGNKLMLWVMKD